MLSIPDLIFIFNKNLSGECKNRRPAKVMLKSFIKKEEI